MEEKKLRELLQSMTVREKIGQLIQLSGDFFGASDLATGPQEKLGIEPWAVQNAGSALNVLGADKVREIQKRHMENSRIPLLFMADIVYGYKTVYPMPLGLACSWDTELVKSCSRRTAREAAPDGAHVTFAPMVDVVRDARWGRCMESPGEDPWLNGVFARAMVEGFQGEMVPGENLASCVKHFAGYGAVEAGREYNTVDMSRWRFVQEYLPPYKAAVDAGCEMVMTSFNTVEGIPATANRWLMEEVLRRQWGFDGVLITDYAAIQELIAHGVAEDDYEAAKLAMNATVDIDMKTPCYANQLEPLLNDGSLDVKKLDEAVWRVLALKNRLGLFEDPYRGIDAEKAECLACNEENRSAARTAVQKCMVLLRNENQVLPLKSGQKIALMGPYADSKDLNGMWAVHGDRDAVVTLKTAFAEVLSEDTFATTAGCEMLDDYESLGDFGSYFKLGPTLENSAEEELEKSIALAKWADVVVFAVGEHMLQSGESGSRTDLTLPAVQRAWMERVLVHAKKSVVLLFNGRPLVLADWKNSVDAILECWFPGTEGAHGIADLLWGRCNPCARLTAGFPFASGQVPVYYGAFRTGRPADASSHSGRFVSRYLDCPNEPLYPFGYGLSYHTAEYSDLKLSDTVMRRGETLTVGAAVKNTGDVSGQEVVQLYLHDVAASVVRPAKELKGFQKIDLEPGEKKEVIFEITEEMLKFYDSDLQFAAQPGMFEVFVGRNAADCLVAAFRYETGR